ncbi:hypothetical protein LB565_13820 [Mesorhizobium sp. CA14]|uniref:hypothetical protein n=1 Tax=Mesorhizobium sp. CA14 TaxID=2876642 RepID=UPI001CCB4854|nr:hypothetical protein [Mesorhizobium sp. CA14]MBZ9849059.1 hypothetical protein [Mesorhizobium sp. CA14]
MADRDQQETFDEMVGPVDRRALWLEKWPFSGTEGLMRWAAVREIAALVSKPERA